MENEFTGDNEFFTEVIDFNMESGFIGADDLDETPAPECKADAEFIMLNPNAPLWERG